MTVMRGFRLDPGEKSAAELFKPGATFSDGAFVSTTLASDVAERFSQTIVHGAERVMVSIDLPQGSNAYHMPRVQGEFDEAELLLPRGARFQVHSVEKDKAGITQVRVKYIGTQQSSATSPNQTQAASLSAAATPDPMGRFLWSSKHLVFEQPQGTALSAATFDESKVHRGQPKNKGQFASGNKAGAINTHAERLEEAQPAPTPAPITPEGREDVSRAIAERGAADRSRGDRYSAEGPRRIRLGQRQGSPWFQQAPGARARGHHGGAHFPGRGLERLASAGRAHLKGKRRHARTGGHDPQHPREPRSGGVALHVGGDAPDELQAWSPSWGRQQLVGHPADHGGLPGLFHGAPSDPHLSCRPESHQGGRRSPRGAHDRSLGRKCFSPGPGKRHRKTPVERLVCGAPARGLARDEGRRPRDPAGGRCFQETAGG